MSDTGAGPFGRYAVIPSADELAAELERKRAMTRRGNKPAAPIPTKPAAAAAGTAPKSLPDGEPMAASRKRGATAKKMPPYPERRSRRAVREPGVRVDTGRGEVDFNDRVDDAPRPGLPDTELQAARPAVADAPAARTQPAATSDAQGRFRVGPLYTETVTLGFDAVGEFDLSPVAVDVTAHVICMLFRATGPGALPFTPAPGISVSVRVGALTETVPCKYMGVRATFGELKMLALHIAGPANVPNGT